jgi:hypothetical protein
MKRLYALALLICFSCAPLCVSQSRHSQRPESVVQTISINLGAGGGWGNTGVVTYPGPVISARAPGRVKIDPKFSWAGPFQGARRLTTARTRRPATLPLMKVEFGRG